MYSIGTFSKFCQVTTKALRHYDEIGLLVPDYTDSQTGYRYYTSSQLPRMHKILAFKQMGFSLTQIGELLHGGSAVELLLRHKSGELAEEINRQQHQLRLIESVLHAEKENYMLQYTATVKQLPKVTVATLRRVIPAYSALSELQQTVFLPELKRLGCKFTDPDYCFNLYLDGEYKEKNIDTKICQAVVQAKQDSDLVSFETFEEATAVCVLHRGSYRQLTEAYGFALKYLEDNGYRLVSCPRESYIDGEWNKENEADWLTELQFPVEKISG